MSAVKDELLRLQLNTPTQQHLNQNRPYEKFTNILYYYPERIRHLNKPFDFPFKRSFLHHLVGFWNLLFGI